mmetsp:Transcript_13089/g.40315  ORF Transcript_13089/g.40315 Transcript_13089/m.40315 type:complete len:458 (+) Transcript_13089:171-1544(+)
MKFTSFDVFRKLPREYTYGTATGGILSILVISLIPALIFFETWTFLSGEIQTDVVIDPNSEESLTINFNVTMLDLPCTFTEVDAYDFFGTKRLDINKDVQKSVVTGELGEQFLKYHFDEERMDLHPDEKMPRTQVPPNFEIPKLGVDNFQSTLAGNKLSFVNFYADWCHFCNEFKPTWNAFAVAVERSNLPVKVYDVNCPDEEQLCTNTMGIVAYPTLRMFHQTTALDPDFTMERTEEALMMFVEHVLEDVGEKPPTKAEEPDAMATVREHKKEGCNVAGSLMVQRVPGNFVILANSREHNFDPKILNTSHIVHHLTFGDQLTQKQLKQIPKNSRHDIDPFEKELFPSADTHTSHEHYIKLVSTFYRLGKLGASEVLGYRMTASNHAYNCEPGAPDVRFSYDMSPTAAVVTRGGRRWYEFLTNLCAIVGGVYVVFRMADGVLFSAKQVMKGRTGKKS